MLGSMARRDSDDTLVVKSFAGVKKNLVGAVYIPQAGKNTPPLSEPVLNRSKPTKGEKK
jgi:hypothetical protein|tara:strand:- start:2430 stop:2606 length:177 start_codon:yes stop_codon:yes gene_type:complete